MNGITIQGIIEEAIEEGLSICDEETQDIFYDWAHNDLYRFLEAEIENKLFRLRF